MSVEPTVLYIAGWSRSGSTILANVLGSVPGFVSIGELHYLWEIGLQAEQPCGCGEPLPHCPFWSRVLERALGVQRDQTVDRATIALRGALRTRHVPGLLMRDAQGLRRNTRIEYYSQLLGSIYREVAHVSGAQIIIDSSKYPADAAILRLVPGIRPFILHLVRDPRAVAHSWLRWKPRLDRSYSGSMPRYGPVYSSLNWLIFNLLAESVRKRYRSKVMRYEDFAAEPRESIAALVAEFTSESRLPFEDERTALLETTHTVNGNPNRMRSGKVEISLDAEWYEDLARSDRLLTTGIAGVIMPRYGYPLYGIGR